MEHIKQQIVQASLTKTEQIIADYILENLNTVALYTITDLARDIGVSDTSVIRFVRTLGFDSFSEFKKYLSAQIMTQYSSNTHDNHIRQSCESRDGVAAQVLQSTLENLSKACDQFPQSILDQAIHLILGSRNKYIAGFSSTACCVAYMARNLPYLVDNVRPLLWADSLVFEQFSDISQEDCLILYTFPPYSDLIEMLLEYAKRSNAKIMLITDKLTTPFTSYADMIIPVPVVNGSTFISYAAPMYISETILSALSQQVDTNRRMEQMSAFVQKGKLY